jgi:hypothetical protein
MRLAVSILSFVAVAVSACGSVPDVTFADSEGGVKDASTDTVLDTGVNDGAVDAPTEGGGCQAPAGGVCCNDMQCIGCQPSDCASCTARACSGGKVCCQSGNGAVTCKSAQDC